MDSLTAVLLAHACIWLFTAVHAAAFYIRLIDSLID